MPTHTYHWGLCNICPHSVHTLLQQDLGALSYQLSCMHNSWFKIMKKLVTTKNKNLQITFLTRKLNPNYIKNSQHNHKKNKSKIRKKFKWGKYENRHFTTEYTKWKISI